MSQLTVWTDDDIAKAYIRHLMEGAESEVWAAEELSQLAISNPERTWRIIERINETPIEDDGWRSFVHAALGCGALEDLIVLHEEKMLPLIIRAAVADPVLRAELSSIYESSVSPHAWLQIRGALAK